MGSNLAVQGWHEWQPGWLTGWLSRPSTCRSSAWRCLGCHAGDLGVSGAVLMYGDWFSVAKPVVRSPQTAPTACRQAHSLLKLVRGVLRGVLPEFRTSCAPVAGH